jgi:predicted Zn-dependent peptidase
MSVQISTLSNGLRVATDTMPGVASVSLGIYAGVGTRHEGAAVNGVAHLVEHMLFKGTPTRSALGIAEAIENVGGHINAYTTRENTAYYAKVLSEDTHLALEVISDIVQHSLFDEEELARERGVVLQEIGQANDTPDDVIYDHFQATAYPGQAMGRPVLGLAEIVGQLPRGALVDYVGSHYTAPHLVLAAAGAVDHDRLVERAEALLGKLPSGNGLPHEAAQYHGGDFREERDLEQLHVMLGFPGVGYHHPGHYAHAVLSSILGGGMSSRLFQEVREKRGLVYSVHSFAAPFTDGGIFGIYAGTGPELVGELIPVLCDEIARLADSLTEEEVARARAQLRAVTLMALESSSARLEQVAQQLLIYGRPIPTEEVVSRINAVDLAAVRQAALDLRTARPTVAALGPLDHLEDYERIVARLG